MFFSYDNMAVFLRHSGGAAGGSAKTLRRWVRQKRGLVAAAERRGSGATAARSRLGRQPEGAQEGQK